jgi:two-component system, sensor histidine kinase and response regulator
MRIDGMSSAPGKTRLHALLVEDNSDDCELIQRELRRGEFEVSFDIVRTPEQFRRRVQALCPDVVLADYNLGQWRGIEAVDFLREQGLDVPVILVSGAMGDETAVECIKRGATDYVLKGSLARLSVCIHRALEEKKLREARKRAEEELAAKVEELARSNRELEQFAYIASHDLQEPLRMVANYTQLLQERYREKLDKEADKYIHYAVDGAVRMQTLVQDLLAFSRVGREGIQMQKVDCNDLLHQVLHLLEPAFRESGAKILFDHLPVVMANRTQLQQVFQNLIANAIKFRGAEPAQIEVSAKEEGGAWQFSVHDNGIGIAPEHHDSIFVIFQRLHTRQEYPGNGIGLSICKKIIERHGGRIWVNSEPGGTTFTFTIPAGETADLKPEMEITSHAKYTHSTASG